MRSDLTMCSYMPHPTAVISSRRHGTTGMIWRITMVFTEVIPFQEKLSLVNRFGVTISYSAPSQKEYFEIVKGLAEKEHITMDEKELCAEANKWELAHGGISGRTAQQFINYLKGQGL